MKGRIAKSNTPISFVATQVYKPGSVLTAIYLVPGSLPGSSRLLGTVGPTFMFLHGVAPDRVYSTPMFPWGGWSLTPPFHSCFVDSRIQPLALPQAAKFTLYAESPPPHQTRFRWALMGTPFGDEATYLCCTCPGVTPGRRYLLSLPCGARTFLTWTLSRSSRGCPTWSREYCTAQNADCQMSCKFFSERIYYIKEESKICIYCAAQIEN